MTFEAPLPPGLQADPAQPVDPPGPGEPWTVLHLIRWAGSYLAQKGVEQGRLDAEHLLAHSLGVKRLDLYLQFDRPLDEPELAEFKPLLQRRAKREPLQYVLGNGAFRDLSLMVDNRVLIPRPETELLIDLLLEAGDSGRSHGPRWERALDIGTGSGALALALANEGLAESVVAVDCSADALAVAKANAEAVSGGDRVEFRLGNLSEPVAGEQFDLVVSNPPYVPDLEWAETQAEVRDWEPVVALKGGADGLDVLRPLVASLSSVVRPEGWVGLEMASDQTKFVAEMLHLTGAFADVAIHRDLTGRPRFVLAKRLASTSG